MPKRPSKAALDRAGGIYRALRHAIIEKAIEPGSKLPEDAIGEQFGASRTIVRNALNQLAAEGLVELRRNRGASVAVPSWDEARDIFDVRLALERLVVDRLSGRLSAEQVAALKAHVDKEEKARGADESLSIRLATEFHILLAEMTGSPVMKRYVSELASRCGLILSIYSRPHSSECAVSEHRTIIKALQEKDIARAARIMSEHLQAVIDRALIAEKPKQARDIRAVLSSYAESSDGKKKRKRANGKRLN
jgi:DNA-binding GntR family transcriptional regulator